jgi:hypothetical protein
VAVGRTYLLPPLSYGGASLAQPWLRLHTPLIEPDMQISRIRLSDKTSRLHPRHVMPKPAQTYEPEVPVEVRGWIGPAPASPDLVLGTQPPTQLHHSRNRSGAARITSIRASRSSCTRCSAQTALTCRSTIRNSRPPREIAPRIHRRICRRRRKRSRTDTLYAW